MFDLINIKMENGKQLVSARELHEFLEVTERFQQWFDKKVNKYEFVENIDFVGCKFFHTLAKQELQDYAITIEMAKELSMVQDNAKGKIARRYFIQCEKLVKTISLAYQEQLKELTNRLNKTERLIGLRTKTVFDYGKYIKNKMCISKANRNYENVKMVLFAELRVDKWEQIDYSIDVIQKIDEILSIMKLDNQINLI